MKRNKIVLITLIAFFLSACNQQNYDYDYIIVGGGLAGLAAAKELNSDKVLIVEKDSVFGGRVKTANFQSKFYYDLGAVFALDSSYRSNLDIDYNEIIEEGKIGFWLGEKLYEGNSVVECLMKIPDLDYKTIKKLSNESSLNSEQLDRRLYEILNTNMKAVFPGALNNFHPKIQMFAFERYNSSHFVFGNKIIVDFFLKNTKFDSRLSSEVLSVEDKKNKVEVLILNDGRTDTLFCKKAIIATTATVANKIIKNKTRDCLEFLEGIKYAGYYSIAIGVKKKILNNDVAYLMPVNSGFSSVLKQNTTDENFTIFQLYIAEEDFKYFENENEIETESKGLLRQIWGVEENEIEFYDQYFWKEAGVLVDNHYLKNWTNKNLKSGNNIYLAGDYCIIDHIMPYGMIPAIVSGYNAARLIKSP